MNLTGLSVPNQEAFRSPGIHPKLFRERSAAGGTPKRKGGFESPVKCSAVYPDTPRLDSSKKMRQSTEEGWVLPNPEAFAPQSHPELVFARSAASEKRRLPVCPDTPARPISLKKLKQLQTIPFVHNGQEIQKRLFLAATNQEWGVPIQPFEIEVAPGVFKTITAVETIQHDGQNSTVYKCTVENEGCYVIKLSKLINANPQEAILMAATQLMRYAQNMNDPYLKDHVAPHLNFDPHLPQAKEMLQSADPFESFKAYVKTNVHQGFSFVPFIPEAFPLEFDPEDDRWIQVKECFSAGKKSGICNDLRRTNVHCLNGKVLITDIWEVDPEEDEPSVYFPELVRTFTDVPGQQQWLLSETEAAENL